jgi:hypothetical protein
VTEGLWYDDLDRLTEEELDAAAKAADDLASHRFQSEEH